MLAPTGAAERAGWRAEGASTGWCSLRAASVVGVRHRLAGLASDDTFAWSHTALDADPDGGRLVVAAVGDGVGSLAGSAGAATRACRAAVSAVAAGLPRAASSGADRGGASGDTASGDTASGDTTSGDTASGDTTSGDTAGGSRGESSEGSIGPDLQQVVELAVSAADEAAGGGGATTLVVAALGDNGRVVLGRVGDSSAFLVSPGDDGVELFGPPEDAMAEVRTAALPGSAAEVEVVEAVLAADSVLVLVTDGVAGPWRDGPTTVAPGLSQVLADVLHPLELLRLLDFSRQGCHDDRTLVALWRRP